MGDPFLTEVRMMGFSYPPRGWASCNGELIPIDQNRAAFSLLGTTFGGDGKTSFALPNLQGRVPIHTGKGHRVGETGGSETVTLTQQELPDHVHRMKATDTSANAADPGNAVLGAVDNTYRHAYYERRLTALHPATVSKVGGGRPHDNMQPYLTFMFCIALEGVFPRRKED